LKNKLLDYFDKNII